MSLRPSTRCEAKKVSNEQGTYQMYKKVQNEFFNPPTNIRKNLPFYSVSEIIYSSAVSFRKRKIQFLEQKGAPPVFV